MIRIHASIPALLGAAVLSVACGGRASAARTPSVPVEVAVAVRKDVPVQREAIGTIEPLATVTIKQWGHHRHVHSRRHGRARGDAFRSPEPVRGRPARAQ